MHVNLLPAKTDWKPISAKVTPTTHRAFYSGILGFYSPFLILCNFTFTFQQEKYLKISLKWKLFVSVQTDQRKYAKSRHWFFEFSVYSARTRIPTTTTIFPYVFIFPSWFQSHFFEKKEVTNCLFLSSKSTLIIMVY